MKLVDTNVFIRYLTKDDPQKAKVCWALLKKAEAGEIELYTTESVISEVVYVLESKRLYNLNKKEIAKKLLPILNIRKLKIPFKSSIIKAVEIYTKATLNFEDAVLVAHALRLNIRQIYSYDRGFDRVSQVKRIEP